MFRDESLETTHPSPGTHAISISSLEFHRMQLILTISYLRYQPFGPCTMISERRLLLVLSRRLRLLIEKKDGAKGVMGRKVFLAVKGGL
jgi:hypothetical protein